MVLFDNEISSFLDIFNNTNYRELELTDNLLEDVGKNNMVFSNEAAFELGGSLKKSLSFEMATSNNELINFGKIYLIGDDLFNIKNDVSFSRITLLNVSDDNLKGEELYDRLEKIKFTKYRVSPKGYMLRTSTDNKEKVRVSKEIASNTSFCKIGSAYIKAYKQLPFVKNVIVIFIANNDELIEQLSLIANKVKLITDTIDHILKGMVINDCDSCSVKELCDEVEGMREIHKNNS